MTDTPHQNKYQYYKIKNIRYDDLAATKSDFIIVYGSLATVTS